MFHIIAIMFCGVILGYFFRNASFTRKTEYSIPLTIISLLFILGLSVGSNKSIISNLYNYSSQAAILAIFSLGGSIIASWLVYSLFFRKGGAQ